VLDRLAGKGTVVVEGLINKLMNNPVEELGKFDASLLCNSTTSCSKAFTSI
jgi:hypothetical protein